MKPTDDDKRVIAAMAAEIYAAILIRTPPAELNADRDRKLKREAVSDAAEILFNSRQIESIHTDSVVYYSGHRE